MNETKSIAIETLKLSHAIVRKVHDTNYNDLDKAFPNAKSFSGNFLEAEIGSLTFKDGVRAVLFVQHGYHDDFDFIVKWFDAEGNRLDDNEANSGLLKPRFFLETKYGSTTYHNGEAVTKHGHELLDKNGNVTHVLNVEDEMPEAFVELEKKMNDLISAREKALKYQCEAEKLDTLVEGAKRHLKEKGFNVDEIISQFVLKKVD